MHRGLFDLRLVDVGVLVPDVVVEDGAGESVASDVVISEDSGSCEPRGEGVKRLRVDDSVSLSSLTVVAGSSCLPARSSLEPAGSVAEAERNSNRLATVWVGLTFRFIPGQHVSMESDGLLRLPYSCHHLCLL